MKIPKHVIIGGRKWKIKLLKQKCGGWFNSNKSEIGIGARGITQEEQEQIFLHEVIEGILAERMKRYKLPYTEEENGHYMFVFNHAEFEEIIKDIRLAIYGDKS